MGQQLLNQVNLVRDDIATERIATLKLTLNSKFVEGKLSVYFREVTLDPNSSKFSRLDIDIHQNVRVTIELDSAIEWFWSNRFSAITTKDIGSNFYSNLQYSECGEKFAYYDDNNEAKRYRFIRFTARYNENGDKENGERFPYNMNINMVNGADGRILPVTFDPDIRNPPPKGG
jgi:hypothetical protein